MSLGLGLQKQEAQVLLGDDGLEEGMGLKSEFEHNSGSHKLLLLLALQHTVSVKKIQPPLHRAGKMPKLHSPEQFWEFVSVSKDKHCIFQGKKKWHFSQRY